MERVSPDPTLADPRTARPREPRPAWCAPGARAAAALIALGAAACEEDRVTEVFPFVSVSPPVLDFGTVELGQESRLPLSLSNLGVVPAQVVSFVVEDDCGGCFLAPQIPTEVLGTSTVTVPIRFRAVRLAVATGTVSIQTSDPRSRVERVRLIGRGSDMRTPDVAVEPTIVNFGLVPAGGVAVRSFAIRSTGTNDLLVDRISIDPPDAPFRITTSTPSPANPGVLAPRAQASVSVRATLPASATGTVSARVLIETNVLVEKNVPGRVGVVAVPLVARPNLPPLAIVGPDQIVEPWSRAVLDGSASRDQDVPPDAPLSYRWEMIARPGGSRAELERARTAQPTFWVDVAGRYEIQLVVTDALGLESQAPAVTVVEARPKNAIRIELLWDHPDADLDLHVIRSGGAFCDCATDVHYRDCGRTPNWFPSTPGANPRLDVDDRAGFGPENVNFDGDGPERFVPDGNYRIAVHYFSSNAGVSSWPTTTTRATVRLYVYGLLAAEASQSLTADGELWVAGALAWPEGTFTPDTDVLPLQRCASF